MHYKASDILPHTGEYQQTLVTLRDGDTMDDPASTNRVLIGPAYVHLTRYQDGGIDAVYIESLWLTKDWGKEEA